jgi:hypothetical protein
VRGGTKENKKLLCKQCAACFMASFSGHLAQFSVFTRCYTVAYEGLEYIVFCVCGQWAQQVGFSKDGMSEMNAVDLRSLQECALPVFRCIARQKLNRSKK